MAYNKTIYIGNSYNIGISMNFSKGEFAATESLLWQNQNKYLSYNQLASPVVLQGNSVYSHQNENGKGYSLNGMHTVSPAWVSLASTANYTTSEAFTATYINYNHARQKGHTIGYGGNIETQFAMNKQGAYFSGIDKGSMAGIVALVHTKSSIKNAAQFALLDANNRKIAILPANKKTLVPLPGFTDENYTLVNLSKTHYYISKPERHITLYPGNIGYVTWRAKRRVIVIGRAIKTKGKPLADTWIHAGKNGIYTDRDGNFQLELAENASLLSAGDEALCHMQLPSLSINKAYLYVGELVCR